MKKTKSFLALIITLMIFATAFTGCGKGINPSYTPASPLAEYERFYNLNGAAETFDYDNMTSFEINQSFNLYGDYILSKSGGIPTYEYAKYQLDLRDKSNIKSYSSGKRLMSILTGNTIDESNYIDFEYYYKNGKYKEAGQSVENAYDYETVYTYLTGSHDYKFRRLAPLVSPGFIESYESEFKNNINTITCTMKDNYREKLFEWYIQCFAMFNLKLVEDGKDVYSHFDKSNLDVKDCVFKVKTNKNLLLSVYAEFTINGRDFGTNNNLGRLTVKANVSFKTGNVVMDI